VIVFLSIAAAMVVAALVWVMVPLLRGSRGNGIEREASNVAILRDQLKELEADVGNGVITPAQYEQARAELLERTLEESKASGGGASNVPSAAGAWTAAILGGTVPIAAALLYFTLGSHEAFSPAATVAADPAGQHDMSPAKVEEMVGKLEAKLQQEPNNVEGWALLAHTYYAMNRMPQAVAAYEHAVKLEPDNATLLADYADALGSQQGGLDGKPMELVARALKVDPTQWKALALAGTAAFDHKDYKLALTYWEKLRSTLPPDSNLAKSVDGSISEARQLGGIAGEAPASAALPSAAMAAAAPAPAKPKDAPAANAAAPGAGIAASVKLAPALTASVAPTDTVWVFVRAATGPKMPLAIIRKEAKDLPATFALDDSMAMQPNMKISSFPEVVVGARVSKTGNAAPQSGDLEGLSKPVKVAGTQGVAVVIDTRIP
jgi:cytochrome c-type biogenesis protein CcmH